MRISDWSSDGCSSDLCGRYALFRWSPAFAALPGFPADQQPHWSLAPGASVLLLRQVDDELQPSSVRWGLTPAWLTDLTRTPAQARAETLAEQTMRSETRRVGKECVSTGRSPWS